MFHMPYQVTRTGKFLLIISVGLLALSACSLKPTKPRDVNLVYPPPPEKARFYYERTIRHSGDVRELTARDRFRQAVTGISGTSFGLAKPYGVAVRQGRIYITDTVQRAVLMFNVPEKDFVQIGTEGPGALMKPIGIDISKTDGRLYVADHSGKRIMVYDEDGEFLTTFGGSQYLRRPSGVAISPDGKIAYVIDTGGVDDREHHRVTMWETATGRYLGFWGTRGSEAGQFNLPLQVTTGPDGNVHVVDGGNFRVQIFTPDGKFLRSIGSIGRRTGQFSRPKGIAVDPEGNIYVVDTAFGNFQIFDREGKLLLFVGDRGNTGGPGEYMLPAGLAIDEDGRVYMVDQFYKKVDIYRPANLKKTEGWLARDLTARKKR